MTNTVPVSESRSAPRATASAYVRLLVATVPGKLAASLALVVATSALEGVGILLLLPLLALAGVEVEHGAAGQLQSAILSVFHALHLHPSLPLVLLAYAGVVVVRALLGRWEAVVSTDLEETFLLRLRQRLYRAIVEAQWLSIVRSRSAELSYALTLQLERVVEAADEVLALATHAVVGAVYLALALRLSVPMTLVALASGGGVLLLMRQSRQRARLAGERIDEATEEMFSTTQEYVAGLRTIKSYGAEERSATLFSSVTAGVANMHVQAGRLYAGARMLFDVGSVLVLCVVVYVAIALLHLPTASVLILLFLFARLTPKLSAIQGAHQRFSLALPPFSDVISLIRRYEGCAEGRGRGRTRIELRHGIRLDDVTFSYEDDSRPTTIPDLNMLISARRTTAIVGPSGSGKSTIADLIMGLLPPASGCVLVDGTALTADRLAAWRDGIGYVAQDSFLFDDTVRANLLWARPDADECSLMEALRMAAADGFVLRLPQGLDTVIGTRGARLSGGERQRLALARALLRDLSLLILDEATSAVDAEQEVYIQRAIEALHDRVTILVIAHRLSSIRRADVIHVIEEGRLVESGSWDQLLARDGRFAALWRAQGIRPGDVELATTGVPVRHLQVGATDARAVGIVA